MRRLGRLSVNGSGPQRGWYKAVDKQVILLQTVKHLFRRQAAVGHSIGKPMPGRSLPIICR